MAGLQGRTFGGYQLAEQLRGGGIADVYRGRPLKSGGREVIVKVIYPEFARQPGFLPHFRHIVQMSGRLASHPHILPLVSSGEESGYLYLVTPYVSGGTLKDWIQSGGRMTSADVSPFCRQLCDALNYAHSLGVIHGNVKPSNIFLFEGRHVLLGDFGLLWDVAHMDMGHAGSGTEAVEFLAPEVASGQVTQYSDIYSLGAVLFATCAGGAPFHAATPAAVFAAHASQPLPSLAQVNPSLAPGMQALDPVIQRAMAKQPDARYPSAGAVAQAVDAAARQAAAAMPVMASQAPHSPVQPSPFAQRQGISPFAPASTPAPFAPTAALDLGAAAAAGAMAFSPVARLPIGGNAFPMAGLGVSAPAAPAGGSSLGQLNPPFPPLPPTATVDEHMEQGRVSVGGETGLQATIRVPAPTRRDEAQSPSPSFPASFGGGDAPLQPTMRMPAPQAPAIGGGNYAAGAGWAGRDGMEQQSQFSAGSAFAPQAPGRSSDLAPILSSPLSPAQFSESTRTESPERWQFLDDDDNFGHQVMPAVQGQGIMAGGERAGSVGRDARSAEELNAWPSLGGADANDLFNDASGYLPAFAPHPEDDYGREQYGEPRYSDRSQRADDARWQDHEGRHGAHGESDVAETWEPDYRNEYSGDFAGQYSGSAGTDANGHGGYDGEYTDEQFAYGDDSREIARFGHESQDAQNVELHDGRPFSPTQLDLPRLTNPALGGLSASWHDMLSDAQSAPSHAGLPASDGLSPQFSDPQMPWRSNPHNSGHSDHSRHSGGQDHEWALGGDVGWAPQATSNAQWQNVPASEQWANAEKRQPQLEQLERMRAAPLLEDDSYSAFDDDRVWTTGSTALKRRRRWKKPLLILVALIMLVDALIVVVARPDICPISGCRTLSNTIHQMAPFLGQPSVATPTPVTVSPHVVTLSVASGKSATATSTLTNSGATTTSWKAQTQGPGWISVNPVAGTLEPGGAETLTISATAAGATPPNTYTATLLVTAGGVVSTTTITVVVTAS